MAAADPAGAAMTSKVVGSLGLAYRRMRSLAKRPRAAAIVENIAVALSLLGEELAISPKVDCSPLGATTRTCCSSATLGRELRVATLIKRELLCILLATQIDREDMLTIDMISLCWTTLWQ